MTEISGAEWEVMRILWAGGETKSSEMVVILQEKFEWSASTVKTLLGRLVEKNLVEARRLGRAYLYSALVDQKLYQENRVKESFSNICQRQHSQLILTVLEDLPMTKTDLEAFERLLVQKKQHMVASVPCNCLPGQCHCKKERKVLE
ncbi:CopY/TcrY family copper transport repressor [Streptococcus hongkongensis]|nr:uracil phosphoribosyltransferase [Streptococcus uberis]